MSRLIAAARPALSRDFIARHPERSEGPRKVRTPSELSEVPRRLRGSGMTVGRVLKNFKMLRLLRHSRRFGIIPCRLPFQSTPFQQRLDVGVAPHEILKQTQCISRTTATE